MHCYSLRYCLRSSEMKTTAERVQAMRDRRYAAGLSQLVLWVPPDRKAEIRELVERHLAGPSVEPAPEPPPAPLPPPQAKPRPVARTLVFADKAQPTALKSKMRGAGFTCKKPGVWVGKAVSAEAWAEILPLALAAGGKGE